MHHTHPDHIEDTSRWLDLLCRPYDPEAMRMNVIVLFAADDVEHTDILGGLMLEYHPKSNCGLLCYIVVSPNHKGLL